MIDLSTASATITVETGTEGALADAAYDLTLVANARADARLDPAVPNASTGTVEIALDAFRVEALHRHLTGQRSEPSASDARKIADKTRGELASAFDGPIRAIVGDAKPTGDGRLAATARIRTRRGERTVPLRVTVSFEGDRRAHIDAELELSLAELGIGPVKGPLGLFRVADRIRVRGRAELGSG
jgi:hypothetical protein